MVFDKRPFENLNHMHKVLINNFNSCVTKGSVTYFLGDMAWNLLILQEVLTQLNGTKILVIGNHDKSMQAMYDCGFDAVVQSVSMVIANELVTMSHYPLLGVRREPTDMFPGQENCNWHGEHKHRKLAVQGMGQFHLHGHIHSGPHTEHKMRILDRQMDVGVVANQYRPVSISAVEGWIAKTKKKENGEAA